MTPLIPHLRDLLAAGTPAVVVRVAQALGSTPREVGAAMVVGAEDVAGTVGGGRLEMMGIERARAMLGAGEGRAELRVPLGPRIGQCCGGHVTLRLARLDAETLAEEEAEAARALAARPAVLLFGAGHTGQATAFALAPLPLGVTVIDSRPSSLEGLPAGIETRALAMPEGAVETAPPGAAYLVMTHDHALDFLIAGAALRRGDAAYVGMIGSATKRETFRRQLGEAGEGALIEGLTLPIGSRSLRDKRPEVIAAMTAAEVCECLLSRQAESLRNRLADASPQCHSEPIRSTG